MAVLTAPQGVAPECTQTSHPWVSGSLAGAWNKGDFLMLQAGPRSGAQRAGLTPVLPHCLLVTLGKSPTAALSCEFVFYSSVHSQGPAQCLAQEGPKVLWVNVKRNTCLHFTFPKM